MNSVMNDTKWNELRLAMHEIDPSPSWSTLSKNNYSSSFDKEWFYHFKEGGYKDIIYVDILAEDEAHKDLIRTAIKKINLPGNETEDGFRIFGYAELGQVIDYI